MIKEADMNEETWLRDALPQQHVKSAAVFYELPPLAGWEMLSPSGV